VPRKGLRERGLLVWGVVLASGVLVGFDFFNTRSHHPFLSDSLFIGICLACPHFNFAIKPLK
jgi:hypothetical protein